MIRIWLVMALQLATLGCGESVVFLDGGTDAEVLRPDGAVPPPDASAVDAMRVDAVPDAAPVPDGDLCSGCIASSACMVATCDGTCVEAPAADGVTCGGTDMTICVAGECVTRGCGDGYREPGSSLLREGCDDGNIAGGDACSATCEPVLLVISARDGEQDLTTGAGAAAAGFDEEGSALVIWTATVGGGFYDIWARRYTAAGVPLDPVPITIVSGLGSGWPAKPTVVGLTAGWAVVWTSPDVDGDSGGIAYAIVDPSGAVGGADAANTTTFIVQNDPSVARVPGGFVVTWTDLSELGGSGSSAIRVRGRIIGDDGAPVGPEFDVATTPGNQQESSVAGRSDGFLVVWTESDFDGATATAILGRRFDLAGDPVDAAPFLVSDRDAVGIPVSALEAAVAPLASGDWGVAWTSRGDDFDGDIRAAVVAAAGAMPVGPSVLLQGEVGIAERNASVAPLTGGAFAVLSHRGNAPGSLVDIELTAVDGLFAPEFGPVELELADAWIQKNGSLQTANGRVWVVWSDDNVVSGVPRALVAQVLPVD